MRFRSPSRCGATDRDTAAIGRSAFAITADGCSGTSLAAGGFEAPRTVIEGESLGGLVATIISERDKGAYDGAIVFENDDR